MSLDIRYRLHQGLHWGILGLVLPVQTVLLLGLGFELAELGFFFAAYGAGNVLAELPTGGLADRYGRVKVYQWSLLITIIAWSGLIFLSSLLGFLICALLSGVSRAMSSGTVESWYAEQLKKAGRDDLHAALGRAGMWITTGLIVGVCVGSVLPILNTQLGLLDNVYVGNVILIVLAYSTLYLLTPLFYKEREQLSQVTNAGSRTWAALKYCWGSTTLLVLLIGSLSFGFVIMPVEAYWQPFFQSYFIDINMISLWFGMFLIATFAVTAAGNCLSSKVLGWFSGNTGLMLLVVTLLATIALLSACFSTSLAVFAPGFLLFYFFIGLRSPLINTLLHLEVDNSIRASALSILNLAVQVGGLLSSLVITWLIGMLGIGVGWSVALLVSLVLSVSFLLLKKPAVATVPVAG
ncbi:MAG: MFS transporter [Pseudomonadales bacterium]|nr:MFS transporter [Pseudomonadales bacterium]